MLHKGAVLSAVLVLAVALSVQGVFYAILTNSSTRASCHSVNKAYEAVRISKESTRQVQIEIAEKLRARFISSNRINPPSSPAARKAYKQGVDFFNDLVNSTKKVTGEATDRVFKATQPLTC